MANNNNADDLVVLQLPNRANGFNNLPLTRTSSTHLGNNFLLTIEIRLASPYVRNSIGGKERENGNWSISETSRDQP